MGKFVSGALAAGTTIGMVWAAMFVANTAVRTWGARQLAANPDSPWAEAILYGS